MKVTAVHLAALRQAIAPLDTAERRERYARRDFPRADLVQDVNKRYRWDLLYASRAIPDLDLYGVYADAHLDTALRRIVPVLAPPVPVDFPVRVLGTDEAATDRMTCGACGRSWDDAIGTTWTPVPAGRCPFEYYH